MKGLVILGEYRSRIRTREHACEKDLSEGSERFPVRVVNNVDSATIAEFTYTSRIVDRSGVLAARRSSIETFCCCNDLCLLECECNSGIYDEHG
nr:Pre-SET zinc-binding region domain containing protein [Haemonchus contortus]